jgi:diguanylate cyclase (GGDEF)-like protein
MVAFGVVAASAHHPNRRRAGRIDRQIVEPLLSSEAQLDQVTRFLQARHSRDLADLAFVGSLARYGALIAFPAGLFLITLFIYVLRGYQRRQDDNTAAELERLSRHALIDSITQLGNHRAFQEEIQREAARALRHNQPLILALIDLDDFNVINNEHGHAYGDLILAKLAGVLRNRRREDRAFRLGADEFGVLLPYLGHRDAPAAMERLRSDITSILSGVTASIGVAELSSAQPDVGTLREQAEAALFEAKRRGRNMVMTFFDIASRVSIMAPQKVQALRLLLADRNVGIAFQPIWNLEKGSVLGYEALMRPPEEYGLDGPSEAFDIAEKIGRVHELDEICRGAILARAIDLPEDALVFMNLSPQSLDHALIGGSLLADEVLAAGLAPNRIVLEITERSAPKLGVVLREVRRLKSLGFRIALDDVGSGNSGLEMMRQLPIDFVKIDRTIMTDALTSDAARGVLAAIVEYARNVDTFVIAEGIETSEMLTMVRSSGDRAITMQGSVDGAQGYLLGVPSGLLPDASDFETLSSTARANIAG